MKPNFLVIGAAKCATSSVCASIGTHPDAFMCEPKEPFFFSRDSNYVDRGWSWYESLFAEAEGQAAIGEGSVHYTQKAVYPDAASRIASDLPDAKLIYITRHPLQQIESHWIMLRSFWPAVREDGIEMADDFNESVRTQPVLVDSARYLDQIDAYRAHFPDDRILVLFFEDFKRDPDAILARCFEFLGIDPGFRVESSRTLVNVSSRHHYDRAFFRPLRLMPGASRIRKLLPGSVWHALRPLLRRSVGGRPVWDDATRRRVLDELVEPSRAFLERYGRPADFWPFES